MAADNKMWEGHRIILPDLRGRLVLNTESFPRPCLDEQKLEVLGHILRQALKQKSPVELRLWSEKELLTQKVFPLKKAGHCLKCRTEKGATVNFLLEDILEIRRVTE